MDEGKNRLRHRLHTYKETEPRFKHDIKSAPILSKRIFDVLNGSSWREPADVYAAGLSRIVANVRHLGAGKTTSEPETVAGCQTMEIDVN